VKTFNLLLIYNIIENIKKDVIYNNKLIV